MIFQAPESDSIMNEGGIQFKIVLGLSVLLLAFLFLFKMVIPSYFESSISDYLSDQVDGVCVVDLQNLGFDDFCLERIQIRTAFTNLQVDVSEMKFSYAFNNLFKRKFNDISLYRLKIKNSDWSHEGDAFVETLKLGLTQWLTQLDIQFDTLTLHQGEYSYQEGSLEKVIYFDGTVVMEKPLSPEGKSIPTLKVKVRVKSSSSL